MNRFAAFAEQDEHHAAATGAAAQPKKAAPAKEATKKVVVVKKPKTAEPGQRGDGIEEYQATTNERQHAPRGGRGGRGNGDRPRGDGERGGFRGRGEGRGRGGRGRGGRGRGGAEGARPVTSGGAGGENEDVNAEAQTEDRTQRSRRGGYNPRGPHTEHRHEGKDHDGLPFFERKQGDKPGQGRKDFKKGGHGKGNWGDNTKPVADQVEGETKPAGEETKEAPRRERRERKPEPEPEKVEEVEEVGFTLQDYLNQKAAKTTGVLGATGTREHEKLNTKGLKHNDEARTQVQTQVSELTVFDMHARAKTDDYKLLGFQAGKDDDNFEERRNRGGRGGRGRGGF